MEQIGYSLVDASGNEVQFFGDTKGRLHAIPQPIVLPNGDQVHCAEVGSTIGGLASGLCAISGGRVDLP